MTRSCFPIVSSGRYTAITQVRWHSSGCSLYSQLVYMVSYVHESLRQVSELTSARYTGQMKSPRKVMPPVLTPGRHLCCKITEKGIRIAGPIEYRESDNV